MGIWCYEKWLFRYVGKVTHIINFKMGNKSRKMYFNFLYLLERRHLFYFQQIVYIYIYIFL